MKNTKITAVIAVVFVIITTFPLAFDTGPDLDETTTLDAFAEFSEHLPSHLRDGDWTFDSFSDVSECRSFPIENTTFDAVSLEYEVVGDMFVGSAAGGPNTLDALARTYDRQFEYNLKGGRGLDGGYGLGPKRVVILMYHRVLEYPKNRYEVSIDTFRWQMQMIQDLGFEVISIYQYSEALRTQNPDLVPDKAVIITIDDGYDCIYYKAWPILTEYEYPFIFYIYTQYTGGGGNSLSWNQIREMNDDELCTIGSHSLTHPNLASAKRKSQPGYNEWLWRELYNSKMILENQLGTDVVDFCWPYGGLDHNTLAVCKRAGYETSTTVAAGRCNMDTSPFLMNRYGIYWGCSKELFGRILQGKRVTDDDWDYVNPSMSGDRDYLIP